MKMTLDDACEAYLRDLGARNLRRATLDGYRSLFRKWQAYAVERELSEMSDFSQAEMRAWRESWNCKPSTQRIRVIQLKAFFFHAVSAGWIPASPMAGIKPPKHEEPPTMPLSRDEMRACLAAADETPKEQALILLMRYSGLAILDAVTLSRDAVDSAGHLTLRRSKSGELVMAHLPERVLEALRRFPPVSERYYFWSGTAQPQTAAKYWRSRLHRVARRAGVANFRPHRLRNTFAVELLLAGVAMHDVSVLLGHSSVATTERHYAPWNRSRRERLVAIVRKVHAHDPWLASDRIRKNIAGADAAVPAITARQAAGGGG